MALIILNYALLASTFVFAKLTLDHANPIFVIGFRMTLAGFLLLGYLFFFQRKKLHIKNKDLSTFFKVSLFHVYLPFLSEFWALQFLSTSKTNLIYTATPFIAAILSYFLLKERLGMKKSIGLAMGFVGLLPILVMKNPVEGHWELPYLNLSQAELVLFVAVVTAAYAWFDIKKLMNQKYSLVLINGFAMLMGGLGALLTCGALYGSSGFVVSEFPLFLQKVLLLILISNIIFYNLYAWLLQRYTLTFLTFAGFLSPIFGAFYGYTLMGEQITWHYGLSLSVIFAALYLFYQEELKKDLHEPSLDITHTS